MTLEHVDWAGATIGLVRAGVVAPSDPNLLIRCIAEFLDVDGDVDSADGLLLGLGFEVLTPLGELPAVIDEDRCITALGVARPHALPQPRTLRTDQRRRVPGKFLACECARSAESGCAISGIMRGWKHRRLDP